MTIYTFVPNDQEISFVPGTDVLKLPDPIVGHGYVVGYAPVTVSMQLADAPADDDSDADDVLITLGSTHLYLLNLRPGDLVDADFLWTAPGVLVVGDGDRDEGDGDADDGANDISGGAGEDLLIGLGGNDTLNGYRGFDVFDMVTGADGRYGMDEIHGGPGGNRLVFGPSHTLPVNVSLRTGTFSGGAPDSGGTVHGVIGVIGTAFDDTMVGNGDGNYLRGMDGNDSLSGGLGKDVLQGVDGKDLLAGGAGDDALYGDTGADTLKGGLGADTLWGGQGNDTFFCDAHDASINGEDGKDTLVLTGSGTLSFQYTVVTGIENIIMHGSNALAFDYDDLVRLQLATEPLRISGGADDTVNSSGWALDQEDLLLGGKLYDVYTQDALTLYIAAAITTNVI